MRAARRVVDASKQEYAADVHRVNAAQAKITAAALPQLLALEVGSCCI
jgi:hypothetical protein